MEKEVRTLKALADESRLRLLLLLGQKELFVCQLMAILGVSQPLVSRSLARLDREGLLESRRSGKQVFYRLKPKLPQLAAAVLAALPMGEGCFARDRQSLELFCRKFQHGTPACDMAMVRKFIDFKNKKQQQGAAHGKTRQKSVH